MSEKIVHVARALARESGHLGDDVDPDFMLDGVPFWTLFERQARAAIAEMREPTKEMCDAGERAMMDCPITHATQPGLAYVCYTAMIDKALK